MLSNNIPYIVQTCDAGNHRRKDRPNGGLYIGEGLVNLTIAAMQPQETLIVKRCRKPLKALTSFGTILTTTKEQINGNDN